jgi:hypothetical protein
MAEIRTEIPDEECAVIDAFCSATGKHRTDVVRELISVWSANKLHEATLIMRVHNGNTTISDRERIKGGL